MDTIFSVLPASLIEPIGWALLHSLWQGALVGVLLAGALHVLTRASSQIRYLTGCAALLMLLGCMGLTGVLFWEAPAAPAPPVAPTSHETLSEPIAASATALSAPPVLGTGVGSQGIAERIDEYLPWVVFA